MLSFGQQSQQFTMPDIHSASKPTQHNPSHQLLQLPRFYTELFFLIIILPSNAIQRFQEMGSCLSFALLLLSDFQKSTFKM